MRKVWYPLLGLAYFSWVVITSKSDAIVALVLTSLLAIIGSLLVEPMLDDFATLVLYWGIPIFITFMICYLLIAFYRRKKSETIPTFKFRPFGPTDLFVSNLWQSLHWPKEVVSPHRVKSWFERNPYAAMVLVNSNGERVALMALWAFNEELMRRLKSGTSDVTQIVGAEVEVTTEWEVAKELYFTIVMTRFGAHSHCTRKYDSEAFTIRKALGAAFVLYAKKYLSNGFPKTIYAIPYEPSVESLLKRSCQVVDGYVHPHSEKLKLYALELESISELVAFVENNWGTTTDVLVELDLSSIAPVTIAKT